MNLHWIQLLCGSYNIFSRATILTCLPAKIKMLIVSMLAHRGKHVASQSGQHGHGLKSNQASLSTTKCCSWTEGVVWPLIFSAALTTLYRASLHLAYHVEMTYVSTFSTAPLENMLRMLVESEACLSFLRKYSAEPTSQVQWCAGYMPRQVMICTPHSSLSPLLMLMGACSIYDLRKPTIISFVWFTFSTTRVLSMHRLSSALTSSL